MFSPSQQIADHYADPYHRGPCDHATHAADRQFEACQARFELLVAEDGTVEEAWFQAGGCICCEALASLLAELSEGASTGELLEWSLAAFLEQIGEDQSSLPNCATLPLVTLLAALTSPIDALDGELADGTNFGGPSLREEC